MENFAKFESCRKIPKKRTFKLLDFNEFELSTEPIDEHESDRDSELQTIITGRGIKGQRLCSTANNLIDIGADCDTLRNLLKMNNEKESNFDSNTFKPICIIYEWEDEREERRDTVAILMPSGRSKLLEIMI